VQAAPPTAPYGLLVGVVAVARTPGTTPAAAKAVDSYIAYRQPNGVSGELLLTTRSAFLRPEVYQGVEDGLTVAYRPFALKLPAIPIQLVSFDTRWLEPRPREETRWVQESYQDYQGKWQTRSKLETVTVQEYVSVVKAADIPTTGFEAAPGKVRYIGRVGMVVRAERLPSVGPASCSFGKVENPSLFELYCTARAPFMENQEAADLVMIRRHFPGLAGVDIELRPREAAPGIWQTLSAAAQRIQEGR
jgi:hypothetical protein